MLQQTFPLMASYSCLSVETSRFFSAVPLWAPPMGKRALDGYFHSSLIKRMWSLDEGGSECDVQERKCRKCRAPFHLRKRLQAQCRRRGEGKHSSRQGKNIGITLTSSMHMSDWKNTSISLKNAYSACLYFVTLCVLLHYPFCPTVLRELSLKISLKCTPFSYNLLYCFILLPLIGPPCSVLTSSVIVLLFLIRPIEHRWLTARLLEVVERKWLILTGISVGSRWSSFCRFFIVLVRIRSQGVSHVFSDFIILFNSSSKRVLSESVSFPLHFCLIFHWHSCMTLSCCAPKT